MSKVIIELPENGWFSSGCNTKPYPKQLCIILPAYWPFPEICQYREADDLHPEGDYFLDVSRKWQMEGDGFGCDWEPGFLTMNLVDRWKPLGLPEEIDVKLKNDIDDWLENA